jgi:hypothetical protein
LITVVIADVVKDDDEIAKYVRIEPVAARTKAGRVCPY